MSKRSITLRGITWEHPRGYDSQVGASTAYRLVEPDVEIVWEERSLLAFGDSDLAELAVDYDLLVVDHPHIAHAAAAGILSPLDGHGRDAELEALAARSVGASHRSYAYAGHQWATACDAAAQVAVHRPDLIAEPPRTWPDVLELARAGRVLWPAKPVDAFSSFVSVAASFDLPLVTAAGTFIDPDDALAVLELLHRLTETTPSGCLGQNPINVAEQLATDDRYVYSPLLFGYTNYSREGFRRSRLAYVNAPLGPSGIPGSMLGGAGVAVSATSSHVDAAVGYAVWSAGSDAQRGAYFDAGGQPAHADAWDDTRLNAETLNFFANTRRTLESATVRPQGADYPAFQNTVAPLITATLRGDVTDRDFVTRMNDAAARSLQDAHPAERSHC